MFSVMLLSFSVISLSEVVTAAATAWAMTCARSPPVAPPAALPVTVVVSVIAVPFTSQRRPTRAGSTLGSSAVSSLTTSCVQLVETPGAGAPLTQAALASAQSTPAAECGSCASSGPAAAGLLSMDCTWVQTVPTALDSCAQAPRPSAAASAAEIANLRMRSSFSGRRRRIALFGDDDGEKAEQRSQELGRGIEGRLGHVDAERREEEADPGRGRWLLQAGE